MKCGETVDTGRRQALKTTGSVGVLGLLSLLGLLPVSALAALDRTAFEAKTLEEALDALGALIIKESPLLTLTAPDVAENGALVPVTIESSLINIEEIAILVDKNPTMLVSHLALPKGTEGFLTTRIRMAQTSRVIALLKADGKFYRAVKEVKVSLGGC